MKKTIYGFIIIFISLFLSSCKNYKYQFYVEVYDNKIIIGENDFHQFYLRTVEGKKARITIKETYVLHKENTSEEYYNAHIGDYPATVEIRVTYNGIFFKEENLTEHYTRIHHFLTYEYMNSDRLEHRWFAVEGYLLTNKANYRYSEYVADMFSSIKVPHYVDATTPIFVKYYDKQIYFSSHEKAKFNYADSNNQFVQLEYSTQVQDRILSFIDSLSWKKAIDYENKACSNQERSFTNHVLYIDVKRTLKADNQLMMAKSGEEVELIYRIDLINGIVMMDYTLLSTTLHHLIAYIDVRNTFFFQLLNEMNLSFDYSNYIKPGIYKGVDDGWKLIIRSDGTFDCCVNEADTNSFLFKNHHYYVMNDKLILTGFCTIGVYDEFNIVCSIGNNDIFDCDQRWEYIEE